MKSKRLLQSTLIAIVLIASLFTSGGASAWSNCPSYITVQWGDTLSGIAKQCGVSMDAIRAANPGLGWWLYAGQVLCIPGDYSPAPSYPPSYNTYVVQWGDTLGKIALRSGTSVYQILAVNPQIYNASLIYTGQVINLPSGASAPPPSHYPPSNHPSPSPSTNSWSKFKIDYKFGMYVRSSPGGKVVASALDDEAWYYNNSNIFIDSNWKVWVEVKISPPANGYATGWILVRDQYGTHFTSPPIDP